ncbi:hypothetical protein GW17_00035472 [Ensete ventricosum]|nr:hypothetical protein GW17_00035472 [Ensete ventricosum]RZR94071.1 hypothetical protein BHM03_00022691 [Ensete ventricosum]
MCHHLTAKKRWENSCVCFASVAEGEVQRLGTNEGVDDGGPAETEDLLLSTVAKEGIDRGGCNDAGRVSFDSRGRGFLEEELTNKGSDCDRYTRLDAIGNRRGVNQRR